MRQGQMQGDGVFMWNDGMVFSGQVRFTRNGKEIDNKA